MPMLLPAASPETVNTFWSRIPGGSVVQRLLGYAVPTDPSSQIQSMAQPMEAPAMGLAHLLPGLASVLPETRALAERLGVPVREISDWVSGKAEPGIYTGYRTATPATIHPGEKAFVPGGTFFTKEPLYAREYLTGQALPGGGVEGGAGRLYRVEGVFKRPLDMSVLEHRNLLQKLSAVDRGIRYKADKLVRGEYAGKPIVSAYQSRNREPDFEVVKLPSGIVQGLLRRGYDAIVMPRELEGAYPTAIGFGGPERMITQEIPRIPATKQAINAYRVRGGTEVAQDLFNRLRPDLQAEIRQSMRRNPPKQGKYLLRPAGDLFNRAAALVKREIGAGRSAYQRIGDLGQFRAEPAGEHIRVTHLPSHRQLHYGSYGWPLVGHSLDREGIPFINRDFGLSPNDVLEILRRSQLQP